MSTQTDSVAPQTHSFEAEVSQVLNLVVNSLYSNKEIFLRELISNASDAVDKLEFAALSDKSLIGESDPAIRLIPDPDAGTLTIEDDGIGMSHDELVKNLGTIAHSGTQAFLKQVEEGDASPSLIGQFGVGFYSVYLVSSNVEVISRAAGSEEAWRWTSNGTDSFTVDAAERAGHGTTVIMHLKESQTEFAHAWKLRHLVKKYSDFVNHAIQMRADADPTAEEKPDPQTLEWETVNQASALWQRPKSELEQKDYDDFYEHLTGDFQGVLAHTHFKIEGTQMFTGLLYLPQKPPFDLFMSDHRRGVRLHVKRVFIMDDCEDLVPQWLRFVRGVIDSNDLPLNVSRELLQDSAVTRTIRKQIIKKTLDLLEGMAKDREEAYKDFWTSFGPVLKEGLHFEPKFKDRLAKLVRYQSTDHVKALTSLVDYVERMPEGQTDIYYIAGESRAAVEGSPHMEALRAKGYEVLFMIDPVDQWAVEGLREFDGKKLVSAADSNLSLEETDEEKKVKEEQTEGLKGLLETMQTALDDRISEVRVTSRLTDSPVCLVVPPGGLNAHLEKLLKAHDQAVPVQKRIMEVNPGHVLIERLKAMHEKAPASEKLTEWVEVLYGQALLGEGSPIPDPHDFTRRLTRLLEQAAFSAVMD